MRRIIIKITMGGFQIEADGYVGKSCELSTMRIASALGIKQEETFKEEYYLDDQTVEQHISDHSEEDK